MGTTESHSLQSTIVRNSRKTIYLPRVLYRPACINVNISIHFQYLRKVSRNLEKSHFEMFYETEEP